MALPKIETPKYNIQLPSTGKNVEFRPFLVKEEKILLIAQESNDQKQMIRAITDVIESCTFGKLDVHSLTSYDFEYLFLQIRGKSVGERIELEVKCKDCKEISLVEVIIDEIQIQRPEEEPSNQIQITPTVGMTLKPVSLNRLVQIDENNLNSVISSVIESIYDDDNVYPIEEVDDKELGEFIDSLSRSTMSQIETYIANQPKLSHTIEWTCRKCEQHNKYVVEGLASFFT